MITIVNAGFWSEVAFKSYVIGPINLRESIQICRSKIRYEWEGLFGFRVNQLFAWKSVSTLLKSSWWQKFYKNSDRSSTFRTHDIKSWKLLSLNLIEGILIVIALNHFQIHKLSLRFLCTSYEFTEYAESRFLSSLKFGNFFE